MPQTYDIVAKNILRDSISSAIFIDDKALESFKSKNYNPSFLPDHNRTLDLYEDFKNQNCLLHAFKFTKSGWKKNKEFYLKNKDLLILDWQLVDTEHQEALKILDVAVKQKSLHFACIYTQEEPENVKRELNRYFWGNISSESIGNFREMLAGSELDGFWDINKNDPDWRDLESFLDNIINANSDNIQNEIQTFIDKFTINEELSESILGLDQDNVNAAYEKLKTILAEVDESLIYSSFHKSKFYSQSNQDDITLYINHTIVKIFRKPQVNGEDLYNTFLTSFLGSEQNVFFSLMGLEMRNRFKENSAFIGKDFDNVSEEAFFYHKNNNIDNDFLFTEFLTDVLKDQVASFLHEKKLDIFNVLDDYYNKYNGQQKQDTFLEDANKTNFYKETYHLNYFYNKLNLEERKKVDFIRFGDIFKALIPKVNNQGQTNLIQRYFVCITPHCDCLNPKKIEFQYWFTEGLLAGKKNKSKEAVLENTDGKYLSFVKIENEIEAIQWENTAIKTKPKTFIITDNKIDKGTIKAKYNEYKIELNLIGSLKENYAQRIANKAFGYPLRVGIDFVKRK